MLMWKKLCTGCVVCLAVLICLFGFYQAYQMKMLSKDKEGKEISMTSEMPQDSNTLVLHFSADGRLPYDWYASWIVNDAFIRSVYGTLTSMTPNGLFNTDDEDSILDVIETESGDPTKLIFRIKKGLFFRSKNENIEATAEDLKFSYSIPFFLKKDDIFEKSDLLKIRGMDKIKSNGFYDENQVTGIHILDKYTIKIDLIHPDPNFITNLSTSKYPIVSKYFYLNKKRDDLTPGLGKYEIFFADKIQGEAILRRKSDIAGYPRYVKFISTNDARGDVLWKDMWGPLNDSYKQELIAVPYGTLGLFFNYNNDLGSNKSFREAIHLAIDRKLLCLGFPYLIPNSQALPNNYWGRIEVEDAQNSNKAKEILSKIGNIPDPFIIKVFGQSEKEMQKPYFSELKRQLKSVGLNPVYVVDDGDQKSDSTIFITGIAVPYVDPSSVFHFFSSGSFYENGYPKDDPIIKKLLSDLTKSHLDEEKIRYSKKISKHLYDQKFFVPLWDLLSVFNVNTERVSTLGDQPGGMRFDISQVQLKR